MLFKLAAVCSLAAVAFAYPSGAPEGTCATLTPKHQVAAQNSKSSHEIYVSPNAIRAGSPTSVTLHGSTFRGFLIVARDASTEQAVQGTWAALDGSSKALGCGITHNSKDPKSQVNVQFTPSRSYRGQLVFRAAVVQDIDTYWNNVISEVINVS
ncbi:putative defense protein 3 [Galendromus occidentalis]|uniref:Defense protein 3 n=1 Tax=Galendromus occidentalis TaxID=34638 RepID=A0AAJ7SGZ6_9ACAR|nr:putative defense protein 3 [Galendromus occidentalis]